jgi:sec-independent protein translocase protein TatC
MSATDTVELPKVPLYTHLVELRNRLVFSIVAWLVMSGAAYFFMPQLMELLTAPLAAAFDSPENKRLIFTSLPEAFITYISLAMMAGFFAAFPVISWQLYRFIAPALYVHEKRSVVPFLIAAPVLFYAGAWLAYAYIFPAAWQFFVSFELPVAGTNAGLPIELEAKLSEYLGLISTIIIAFGVSFQLPLILLLLIRAGIVEVASLQRGRKYAIVALLIVAAILTPPDIISQIGLFVPLYGFYEAAILLGRTLYKTTPPAL